MERKRVEYYINGKLFKSCAYSKWDKLDTQIDNLIDRKGYVYVYSDHFKGISHKAKVYANPSKGRCITVEYKIFTGYTDAHKNRLYEGDYVKNIGFWESMEGELNHRALVTGDSDGYYVRNYESGNDYDLDESVFGDLVKVKDVNGTPKKYWKNPQAEKNKPKKAEETVVVYGGLDDIVFSKCSTEKSLL